MKVVLDCNVVISAARNAGTCRSVIVEATEDHEIVLSQEILAEYRAVAARPKHSPYRFKTEGLIDLLSLLATFVELTTVRQPLPDESDRIYLAAALAAHADALITGNVRHFPRQRYGGVAVMTPRQFLDRNR